MKTNKKFKLISAFWVSLFLVAFFAVSAIFGFAQKVKDASATNSDRAGGTYFASTGFLAENPPATVLVSVQESGSFIDKLNHPLYYHESFGVVYCDSEDKATAGARFFTNFVDGNYRDEITSLINADDLTPLEDNKNNSLATAFQINAQINSGEIYMVKDVVRDGSLNNNLVYYNTSIITVSVSIDGSATDDDDLVEITLPQGSNIFSDGTFYFFYYQIGSESNVKALTPVYKTETDGTKTNVIDHFYKGTSDTSANRVSVYSSGQAQVAKVYINVNFNKQDTSGNTTKPLSSVAGIYGTTQGGAVYVIDSKAEHVLTHSENGIYIYNGNRLTYSASDLSGYNENGTVYKVYSGSTYYYFDGFSAKQVSSTSKTISEKTYTRYFTSTETDDNYVPLRPDESSPFVQDGNNYYFNEAELGEYSAFYSKLYYKTSTSSTGNVGITTKLINEAGEIVDNELYKENAYHYEYGASSGDYLYIAPIDDNEDSFKFNYYISGSTYTGVQNSEIKSFEHYYTENSKRIYISNDDPTLSYKQENSYSSNKAKITEKTTSVNSQNLVISIGEFGNKITSPANVPVYLYKDGSLYSETTLSGDATSGYYINIPVDFDDMFGGWELLVGCAKNAETGEIEAYNNGYFVEYQNGDETVINNFYTYLPFSLVKESDYYVTTKMPQIHKAEPFSPEVVVQNWFNAEYIYNSDETQSKLPFITFDTSRFKVEVVFTALGSTNSITYGIARNSASTIVVSKNGETKTYALLDTDPLSSEFKFYLTDIGYFEINYTPITKQGDGSYSDLIISNPEGYQTGFNLTNFGYQLQYTQYSENSTSRANFFAFEGELNASLEGFEASGVISLEDLFIGSKDQKETLSSEVNSIDTSDLASNITSTTVSTNQAPATFINSFSGKITNATYWFKDVATGNWTEVNMKSTDFFSKAGDYIVEVTFSAPNNEISGSFKQFFAFTLKNSQTEYTINSYNIIYNNGTGYDWFDGEGWKTLEKVSGEDYHFTFTYDAGETYIYFYINELTEKYYIATDDTYSETGSTTLYLSAHKDATIENGSFTNGNVLLRLNANASQFDVKPQILVQYSDLNYSGSTIYTGQNIGIEFDGEMKTSGYIAFCDKISFTQSRKYIVTLFYGPTVWGDKASFVSWNFNIDKNKITYVPFENETELGDETQVIGGNNYFKLTFGNEGFKTSGAKINAYYYYTPITLNQGATTEQLISGNKIYITTHYVLDFQNKSILVPYEYGTVKHIKNNPGLYEFILIDEAGNKSTYFIFLDNVSPEYVIENLSADPTSPRYSLTWGDFKAVLINDYTAPTKDSKSHESKISANVVNQIDGENYLVGAVNSFNINFYPEDGLASENASQYPIVDGVYTFKTPRVYSFNEAQTIQSGYADYLKITQTGYSILKTKRNEGRFIAFASDEFGNSGKQISNTFSFDLSETTIYVKDNGQSASYYFGGVYPNLVNNNSSNLDFLFMTALTEGTTNFGTWKLESIIAQFYPLIYGEDVYSNNPTELIIFDSTHNLLSDLTPEELIKVINETLNSQSQNGKYVITRNYAEGFTAPPDLFEAMLDENGFAIATSGVYYKNETTGEWFSKTGDSFVKITDSTLILSLNENLTSTGGTISQENVNYAIYEREFFFDQAEEKYFYNNGTENIFYDQSTFIFTLAKKGIITDTVSKTWVVYIDRVKPIDKNEVINSNEYVGKNNHLSLQPEGENIAFNEFVLDWQTISLDTNLLSIALDFLNNKYNNAEISANPFAFFNLRATVYREDENGVFSIYKNLENVLISELENISLPEGTYRVTLTDSVSNTIFDNEGLPLPANSVSFAFKGSIRAPEARFSEGANVEEAISSPSIVLDGETTFVSVKTGTKIYFIVEDPIDYFQAKVKRGAQKFNIAESTWKTLGLLRREAEDQGNYAEHGGTRYIYYVSINTSQETVNSIKIEFKGDKENYKDSEGNYFFSQIYTCTVDGTLPTFNENILISDDINHGAYISGSEFNYNIKENRDFNNYPFYMDSQSEFGIASIVESVIGVDFATILNAIYEDASDNYLAKLDTYKIFLRKVTNSGIYSNPSTMPGEEEVIDRPIFSGIAGGEYFEFEFGMTLSDAVQSAGFSASNNIEAFEIIEVDAAGNYQSYFVFYRDFASPISLDVDYENYFITDGEETSISPVSHSNSFANGNTINSTIIPTVIAVNSINKYLVVEIANDKIYLSPEMNFNDEVISKITGAGAYQLNIYDKKLDSNCIITINVAGDEIEFTQNVSQKNIITASYNEFTYPSNLVVTRLVLNGDVITSLALTSDNSSPAKAFSTPFKEETNYNLPASETTAYIFNLTDNFGRKTEEVFSAEENITPFFYVIENGSVRELNNEETTGLQLYFNINSLIFETLTASNISFEGDTLAFEVSGGIVSFDYKPNVKSKIVITAVKRDGTTSDFTATLDTTLPTPTFQKSNGVGLTLSKADDAGWNWNVELSTGTTIIFDQTGFDSIVVDLAYTDENGNVYTYRDIFNSTNIKSYSNAGSYSLVVRNTLLGTAITYNFTVVDSASSFFYISGENGEILNPSFINYSDGINEYVQYFTNTIGFNIVLSEAFELEFLDQNGNPTGSNIGNHSEGIYGGGDNLNYWLFHIKSKTDAPVEFEQFVKISLVTTASSTVRLDGSTIDRSQSSSKEILISKQSGSAISFTTNVESGNYLTAYIYYKSKTNLVHKIVMPKSISDLILSIDFNEPGLFYLEIKDLAGNYVTFGGENYLTIVNLSKITATTSVGGKSVSLMNGLVLTPGSTISIDNFSYLINGVFNVTKDGVAYLSNQTASSITLNETGFYAITLSGLIAGGEISGNTYYVFVINPNSARLGLEYFLPSNYEITSVYQSPIGSSDKNIYRDYEKNKLALSYNKNGNSHFYVDVTAHHGGVIGDESFSFEITIANNTPVISSNVNFAETTTKTIILSFNPHDIYSQQGACKIVIKNRSEGTELTSVTIDATSANSTQTISISSEGIYDIQIWSESGETLFYWTSVGYKTPLNTVAIVLIVIGSIGVAAGVVLFIVLRTKMKVR